MRRHASHRCRARPLRCVIAHRACINRNCLRTLRCNDRCGPGGGNAFRSRQRRKRRRDARCHSRPQERRHERHAGDDHRCRWCVRISRSAGGHLRHHRYDERLQDLRAEGHQARCDRTHRASYDRARGRRPERTGHRPGGSGARADQQRGAIRGDRAPAD